MLAGVTLRAGSGLTVVTGASGVGKTTLLELVAGLRRPSAGTVLAPAAHLVAQRPVLVAGSVADNLRLGPDRAAGDDELWAALDRVGLADVVARLPERLTTRLGDEGFGLSAGQRARLALARALLTSRPVLLLDEPTAHMDAEAAALVHATIRDLARERIVIAASHEPGLVALADRRLDLDRVRAVDGGPVDAGPVDVGAAVAGGGAP